MLQDVTASTTQILSGGMITRRAARCASVTSRGVFAGKRSLCHVTKTVATRSALRGWRRRQARADGPISSVAKQTERPVRTAQRAARHSGGAVVEAKSLVHGHVSVGSRGAARSAAIGQCLKVVLLRCDETQTPSASEANRAISSLALFNVARITDRRGAATVFSRGRQPAPAHGSYRPEWVSRGAAAEPGANFRRRSAASQGISACFPWVGTHG